MLAHVHADGSLIHPRGGSDTGHGISQWHLEGDDGPLCSRSAGGEGPVQRAATRDVDVTKALVSFPSFSSQTSLCPHLLLLLILLPICSQTLVQQLDTTFRF